MQKQFPNICLLILILSLAVLAEASELYKILRVVDGDTVVLSEIGKVRLIGVDTPETVDPRRPVQYFGVEASQYLKKLATGKQVRVEYDFNRRDRFGRTLAYLYLEDGTFLNSEIIKQGYGHAFIKYPFKFMDQFKAFEKQARINKVGLWADRPDAKSAVAEASRELRHSSCGTKSKCAQMNSCDEARHYLNDCGLSRLDGDHDGVPCEKLCGH